MKNPTEKIPPYNSDAEQGVLGCALLNNELIDRLDPEWFYDGRHRHLAEGLIIARTNERPVDLRVLSECISPITVKECGGMDYISDHLDKTPSAVNFPFYEEILEGNLTRRKILTCYTLAIDKIYTEEIPSEEIAEWMEIEVLKIRRSKSERETATAMALVHECIDGFEDAARNRGKPRGLQTGFIDLDAITNGLKPCELFILAARPGVGKTSFAMNVAENVAIDREIPVAVFTLEMSPLSLVNRMMCSRARVNSHDAARGELDERDCARLIGAGSQIARSPLHVIPAAGWSVQQIRQHARRIVSESGVRLIIVDYLQLVGSGKSERANLNEHISAVSMGLKKIACENNVVVIALSQLSRDSAKENRKPQLSDLRDSGAIEQDADIVGLMHPHSDSHAVELIIAKNRSGPSGPVHLTFLKPLTRFESQARV